MDCNEAVKSFVIDSSTRREVVRGVRLHANARPPSIVDVLTQELG